MFQAVRQNEARTNNSSEGWHLRFMKLVGKHHPSFHTFLREARKDYSDIEVMLYEVEQGRPVKRPQRKNYAKVNARLHTLTGRYQDYKEPDSDENLNEVTEDAEQEPKILKSLRAFGNNIEL